MVLTRVHTLGHYYYSPSKHATAYKERVYQLQHHKRYKCKLRYTVLGTLRNLMLAHNQNTSSKITCPHTIMCDHNVASHIIRHNMCRMSRKGEGQVRTLPIQQIVHFGSNFAQRWHIAASTAEYHIWVHYWHVLYKVWKRIVWWCYETV